MRRTMRTGLIAILSAAALITGCRSSYQNRVNQDLWERELRLQEDCIYRLKWALEDKQRELDDANQRLGTTKKEVDIFRGSSGAQSGPDLGAPPAFNPAGGSRGNSTPTLPPAPELPEVQPGKEFVPGVPA